MAVTFASQPARVRVPATSANLGPGFDALGLALALYDDVSAEITASGCQVTVRGAGAGELPSDENHLVVRAMLATFDSLGDRPPGLALECVNRIPQARGLGSSSAAIVAGVLLARALVADGAQRLDDAAVLRIAADLEGHPDNVAPCLLGGFTIAWSEPGARAISLAVAPGVRPTVFVPAERGLTSTARAALPERVLTVRPDLLFPATEDTLHQGYRAAGAPETAALVAALREAGVAAVVSGAGPSVLALTEVPAGFDPGINWQVSALGVESTGAVLAQGRLGHAERDTVAAGRRS